MRETKIAAVIWILCLLSGSVAAQECPSQQHATPITLVAYLDTTLPNEGNAECITVAIDNLTPQRFEAAIPALVKLLDFRRPHNEKVPYHGRPLTLDFIYPAAAALEEIGEKALPAVLDAIKFSISAKGRENAVAVWMEIYKYEPVKGVRSLQQEAIGAADPVAKDNLMWALTNAPTLCGAKEKKDCKAAASVPAVQ